MKYPNTRRALERYDRVLPQLEAEAERLRSLSEYDGWSRRFNLEMHRVRLAYWKDTKEINSLEQCMLVSIAWIRERVET